MTVKELKDFDLYMKTQFPGLRPEAYQDARELGDFETRELLYGIPSAAEPRGIMHITQDEGVLTVESTSRTGVAMPARKGETL